MTLDRPPESKFDRVMRMLGVRFPEAVEFVAWIRRRRLQREIEAAWADCEQVDSEEAAARVRALYEELGGDVSGIGQ